MFNLIVEGRVSTGCAGFFDLELEDGASLIDHVKAIPGALCSATVEFRRCIPMCEFLSIMWCSRTREEKCRVVSPT